MHAARRGDGQRALVRVAVPHVPLVRAAGPLHAGPGPLLLRLLVLPLRPREVAEQNGIRGLLFQKQWCLQCTVILCANLLAWVFCSPCCSCIWAPCIMTAYGTQVRRAVKRKHGLPDDECCGPTCSTCPPLPTSASDACRSSSRIKRSAPPTRCSLHEVRRRAPPPSVVACVEIKKVHGAFTARPSRHGRRRRREMTS